MPPSQQPSLRQPDWLHLTISHDSSPQGPLQGPVTTSLRMKQRPARHRNRQAVRMELRCSGSLYGCLLLEERASLFQTIVAECRAIHWLQARQYWVKRLRPGIALCLPWLLWLLIYFKTLMFCFLPLLRRPLIKITPVKNTAKIKQQQ